MSGGTPSVFKRDNCINLLLKMFTILVRYINKTDIQS